MSNALRWALVLYNISNFLDTCRQFSVASAVENDTYHNLVIFGQKLRVERTGNVKLFSYLPGGLFDLKEKQKLGLKILRFTNCAVTPRPFTSSDTILATSRNLLNRST